MFDLLIAKVGNLLICICFNCYTKNEKNKLKYIENIEERNKSLTCERIGGLEVP